MEAIKLASLVYFLAVNYLLGCSVDLLVFNWKASVIEKQVMRFGIGLAFFIVLGILLNLVGIPLDWRVFLAVGTVAGGWALVRSRRRVQADKAAMKSVEGKGQWVSEASIMLLFALSLQMYISGAFTYPWLENGDPWNFTASAKYIASFRTFSAPSIFVSSAEPYTQGYQILMGVTHQTNESMYWNMKFFNALLVSCGVPFFFFFVRNFSGDKRIAMTAAFFLFSVPAWVSHFVFSLNAGMILFVISLYVFERLCASSADEQRGWQLVGAVVVAALWVNHFYTGLVGTGLLFAYWANKVGVEKYGNVFMPKTIFSGMVLSLVFYIPAYSRHWDKAHDSPLGGINYLLDWFGSLEVLGIFCLVFLCVVIIGYNKKHIARIFNDLFQGPVGLAKFYGISCIFWTASSLLPFKVFSQPHTGYGIKDHVVADFFYANSVNMIDNPIGIGWGIMGLFCVGVSLALARYNELFTPDKLWFCTSLVWSTVAIFVVLGSYFPVTVSPHRMWTYLGLFVSLIAAHGTISIFGWLPNQMAKTTLCVLIVILVLLTSFKPKYETNTAIWPDHMVVVPQSRELYEWMRSGGIPKNSRVLRLCGSSYFLAGYDMGIEPLLAPTYYKKALDKTAQQNRRFLVENKIHYITAGQSCAQALKLSGQTWEDYMQRLQIRLNELITTYGFTVVAKTDAEILLKVR